MKKAFSILLLLTIAFSLVGCDELPPELTGNTEAGDTLPGYPDEDGYAEGALGDTMHNRFFDFTVHSASLMQSVGDTTAPEDTRFLVVELTVANTFDEDLPMFNQDFEVYWSSDEDDYAYPLDDSMGDTQLPANYTLNTQEERSGQLIFQVPDDVDTFAFSYLEIFEDETYGDYFVVYFAADPEPETV